MYFFVVGKNFIVLVVKRKIIKVTFAYKKSNGIKKNVKKQMYLITKIILITIKMSTQN